jgi:hypothetical protein
MSLHLTHATKEYHQLHPKWFLSLWYVRCEPWTYLASRLHYPQTDWNELPLDLRHLGVPSSVAKDILEPMVHSAETLQLPCIEINNISKRTKTSFHLTNVTQKYHRLCLKRFPCPWYIQHKPCTYLAPPLTISPNRPKWASTWHTSPRSTIACAKMISLLMVHSEQPVHLSYAKINTISKRTETSFHLTHVT